MYVGGRKSVVTNARVFIAVLSLAVETAIFALRRLLCSAMMLYNYTPICESVRS